MLLDPGHSVKVTLCWVDHCISFDIAHKIRITCSFLTACAALGGCSHIQCWYKTSAVTGQRHPGSEPALYATRKDIGDLVDIYTPSSTYTAIRSCYPLRCQIRIQILWKILSSILDRNASRCKSLSCNISSREKRRKKGFIDYYRNFAEKSCYRTENHWVIIVGPRS